MRFTASLRKDETAKTVRPTGVPEKGPATRSARGQARQNDEIPASDLRSDVSKHFSAHPPNRNAN